MRIAIFTDTFLPNINGIVTSIVNSSKELAKRGHQVIIFTSQTKKTNSINLGNNISIEHFKPLNLIEYPDFDLTMPNPKIIKSVLKFKPDIIHSYMPSLIGWEALFCSKVFEIPIIGTYETLLPGFLKHFLFFKRLKKDKLAKKMTWSYTRNYYNKCDLVTTPSIAMKKVLIKHKIKKPIKVISNGVDLVKFYPKRINRNGKTIIHVGRISYEKNIDFVIRSFKLLLKEQPKATLLIIGQGPDENKLKKEAGKYLNKNIKFLGPVPHEELVNFYNKADIFATASTIETEGLVILEAMACELPIIGVNKLAIPYIVKHGKNGFLATPYDEIELADGMKKLIGNKKLRKEFGKESLKIVREFSLNKAIDDLEKAYFSLAKSKGIKKLIYNKLFFRRRDVHKVFS